MSASGLLTTASSPNDRTLLTTDEVANILRVTPRTVRRWSRAGALDSIRLGRLVRYTPASVEALICHENTTRPQAASPGAQEIFPSNDVEPAGNRLDEKVRDDGAQEAS